MVEIETSCWGSPSLVSCVNIHFVHRIEPIFDVKQLVNLFSFSTFRFHATVKKLMEKTKTKKGLYITVDIIAANYLTSLKAPPGFKELMPLVFDDLLPKLNYRADPLAH